MIKDPETGMVYHTLKDFCKFKGINYGAFYRARYVKGFSVGDALKYVRDKMAARETNFKILLHYTVSERYAGNLYEDAKKYTEYKLLDFFKAV